MVQIVINLVTKERGSLSVYIKLCNYWLVYFGYNTECDLCLQSQSVFNVRDTILSTIEQLIIIPLTK
jgi:hypothetical protein